jgi:hypothetical protein
MVGSSVSGLLKRGQQAVVGSLYRSDRIKETIKAGLLAGTSRFPIGKNVYEREWDLLVVLDTCRVDALRAVAPEYEFVEQVDSVWSVGSATAEWTANTFTTEYLEEIGQTACITANGTVEWTLEGKNTQLENDMLADRVTDWDMVGPEDFLLLDSVWEYGPRDPYGGLLIPEVVTDRAVSVSRERNPERLITHYMPPHAPYRAGAVHSNRQMEPYEADPWGALKGGTARETVWSVYLDELRWALDNVAVLLENVDADDVVITADHGDAFGEWGVYSHPMGVPHPQIRKVPWARTSATDEGAYTPSFEPGSGSHLDRDVEDQLTKLGYM